MQRMKWTSFAILLLVVVLPMESLRAAAWVPNLESLAWFAIGGAVVGLVAARTPLRPIVAHLLGLAIGGELVFIHFARIATEGEWGAQVAALATRISTWLDAARRGGASNDTVMFALTLALLAWTVAYFGAWYLLRTRSPWWTIVPSLVVVLLNCSYDWSLLRYFYATLAASLLLLAAVDEWRRQETWARRRVPSQAGLRLTVLGGAALAAPLLLLAWQVPALHASDRFQGVWDTLPNPLLPFQTQFERLFSAVQARQGGVRALAFASSISPRGAFELGDTPLLEIEAPRGAYWRANTLDYYTGQAMVSTDVTEAPAGPGLIGAGPPDYEAREMIEQRVRVLANRTSAVFAVDTPVEIQAPALLAYRGTPADFAALRLAVPLRRGEEYTVQSSVSVASAEQLRKAGTDYPDWVRRYLQLPDTLPQRVHAVATRVTMGAPDPYDKALRVEAYLRDFPYTTTDVPTPPPNRDWVDYMLFDAKRGYCDYYATAMVVLLRSQGVPARVAQGFATGEYDAQRHVFIVRESQAHSWVEVFFPRYGWIVFEPSAARPLPYRPDNPLAGANLPPFTLPTGENSTYPNLSDRDIEGLRALRDRREGAGDFAGSATASAVSLVLHTGLVVLIALTLLVGMVAVVGYLLWVLAHRGLLWHQRLYAQTVRLAALCGIAPRASHTPYEQARYLGERVPTAGPLVAKIAEAYVAGTYGHGASPEQQRQSDLAWRALRVLLPKVALRRRARALLGSVARLSPRRGRARG